MSSQYADTAGDNADYPVPEAYLYRDYIIDSFNADKPYDEFVREQIAGDLLARAGRPTSMPSGSWRPGFWPCPADTERALMSCGT